MTFRSLRIVSLPLALALLALAGCGKSSPEVLTARTATALPTVPPPATPVIKGGPVAAIVNGHRIPTSRFRLYVNLLQRRSAGQPGVSMQQVGQQAMNDVIIDELIRQYAAAHGITVSRAEVNSRIRQDEKTSGGKKGLEQRLAQQGLTFADYQSLLENNVRGLKVVNKVAPLPKKSQPGPMQPVAHVRHILIAFKPQGKPVRSDAQAHAEAECILTQLKHGADFTALAKKYSDDTGSAQRGGVYDVHPHEMVPQFEHASFTLPLHQPTIVKTQFGYHIIEVLSRGKAPAQSLSPQQVQEQRFTAWINQQMKRASIKRIATVTA